MSKGQLDILVVFISMLHCSGNYENVSSSIIKKRILVIFHQPSLMSISNYQTINHLIHLPFYSSQELKFVSDNLVQL